MLATQGTPKTKVQALRRLLESGASGTQEELRDELEKDGFAVTQSTISRLLRKLGAVKATDEGGQTVYRLRPTEAVLPPTVEATMADLVLNVASNGSLVVIHTTPGSASLVARHLDHARPAGILGTIAGDDTIFVAPQSTRLIKETLQAIQQSLQG